MKEEISHYDRALAGKWKEGDLAKAWRRKYPEVFDDVDLRLTSSQPRYHFLEWLAAVQYFERGYLALVEQYIYETHPRKVAIVQDLVGLEGLTFLRENRSAQPPDLLVYTRSRTDFFFVEVKRPKEKLSLRQEKAFGQIESCFGREITVLRLYAQKAQEGSKNDD